MASSASERTPAQRRAAQRKLAKEIKTGTYKPFDFGRPKAAKVLGYTRKDWQELEAFDRLELRNTVRNAERRIANLAKKPKSKRGGKKDWETWEWELYKEAIGA